MDKKIRREIVWLSEPVAEALRRRADADETSRSSVICALIEEGLGVTSDNDRSYRVRRLDVKGKPAKDGD